MPTDNTRQPDIRGGAASGGGGREEAGGGLEEGLLDRDRDNGDNGDKGEATRIVEAGKKAPCCCLRFCSSAFDDEKDAELERARVVDDGAMEPQDSSVRESWMHVEVDRLADDHANARRLAQGLATIEGISVNPNEVDTNMAFFDVAGLGTSAAAFAGRMLSEYGIRVGPMGPTLIRAVTHLDVDTSAVDEAIAAARDLAAR